jgi:maltose O-acetyltransferase
MSELAQAASAPSETDVQRAVRFLRSPSNVFALVRARIGLRRCREVPWSVRLRGRVRVAGYGGIVLGERVRIDGRTVPVELAAWDGSITIGDGTFINYGTSISSHSGVTIGKDCLIGNYVLIMDSDYHDLYDRRLPGQTSPIVIGDGAWIGARSIVLKGVRIGEGAVVAAGSTVVQDVPPRTVVGNPTAQVLRVL